MLLIKMCAAVTLSPPAGEAVPGANPGATRGIDPVQKSAPPTRVHDLPPPLYTEVAHHGGPAQLLKTLGGLESWLNS